MKALAPALCETREVLCLQFTFVATRMLSSYCASVVIGPTCHLDALPLLFRATCRRG